MERNYRRGMRKTSNADTDRIKAWGQRYRVSMERVLQMQCKR